VKAIGVLSARVRVEEKQIIAAVGMAGAVGLSVPPPCTAMPPGPATLDFVSLGIDQATAVVEIPGLDRSLSAVIDRCQNRTIAAVALPILRASGIQVLDAGIAADRSRLDVARALAAAGVPRPECLVGFSEESGVEAARAVGFPATLLPLMAGSTTTSLLDSDTAEAVIEHRVVLGTSTEAIVLIQAGSPSSAERTLVHVVGGHAVAVENAPVGASGLKMAEKAADAVGANIISVELARLNGTLVVWDLHPVGDFRQATLLGSQTVAEAIVDLAVNGIRSANIAQRNPKGVAPRSAREAEERHGVALTA